MDEHRRVQLHRSGVSELVGANGVLYLSDSREGRLLAFAAAGCDTPPCAPLWTAQIDSGDGGSNYADPVIADGTVYSTGNALYAYRLPATISRPPVAPDAPTSLVVRDRRQRGRIEVRWRRPNAGSYRVLAYDVEAKAKHCAPLHLGPRFAHATLLCGATGSPVRVRAVSPAGAGPWSPSTTAR